MFGFDSIFSKVRGSSMFGFSGGSDFGCNEVWPGLCPNFGLFREVRRLDICVFWGDEPKFGRFEIRYLWVRSSSTSSTISSSSGSFICCIMAPDVAK